MSSTRSGFQSRRATSVLLSLNAMLLLAIVFQWTPPAPASADPTAARRPQGVINPADQRKEMISELRRINQKLDALNEKISKPFEVRVIDMPSDQND